MFKVSGLGLVLVVAALTASSVLAQEPDDGVRMAGRVDQACRAAVRSLPASSSVTAYEAQVAGAVEGTGADQAAFSTGLTACANAPGLPSAAVTAIRNLLGNVGLGRLSQTGSVPGVGSGSSAFSSPPGVGGGGGNGSDYGN